MVLGGVLLFALIVVRGAADVLDSSEWEWVVLISALILLLILELTLNVVPVGAVTGRRCIGLCPFPLTDVIGPVGMTVVHGECAVDVTM